MKTYRVGHFKTQKKSRAIFWDFHPGKGTFGYRHTKRLGWKSWSDGCWIPYQKPTTQNVFKLLNLALNNRLLWGRMNLRSLGLRGISATLNITATNPENLMPLFLLGIQNKLSQNFRSSRFEWTTQKSFLREKNPGTLPVTFLMFRQMV